MYRHTGERRYQCTVCEKNFFRNSHLKTHMLSHQNKRDHICNFNNGVCQKSFLTKQKLTRHLKTHTDHHPYQCTECGEKFRKLNTLKTHQFTHRSDGNQAKYFCNCGLVFDTKNSLRQHKRKIHDPKKTYQCDINGCQQNFVNYKDYRLHGKTEHLNLECNICNKIFKTQQNIKKHKLLHSTDRPLFKCSDCEKSFTKKNII